MVRYAYNLNGILNDAQTIGVDQVNHAHRCFHCDQPVFFRKEHLKHSQRGFSYSVLPHFVHEHEKDECVSNNFVSSKRGEGENHRGGKKEFQYVLNQSLKAYYPNDGFATKTEFRFDNHRRADVALIDKYNLGILIGEIQTSPMSLDEIGIRNEKDRMNGIGRSVWAFGNLPNLPVYIRRALKDDSIVLAFEEVETKILKYTITNKRTGIPTNLKKTVESYFKFNQHTKDAIIPPHFTTDIAAIIIYDAIKQREELRKNRKFFDMGASNNNALDSLINQQLKQPYFNNNDTDNSLYDTNVSSLSSKQLELESVKLVCRTSKGIGVAIEFDTDKELVKVVLVGGSKNSPQKMKFKDVFVSREDHDHSLGLKEKRNRSKNTENTQSIYSNYNTDEYEVSNEQLIILNEYISPVMPCNQDIVNTITPIQSDGSEHDLNLKPEPILNTNTGVTEIKEGDGFVLLRPIPLGVTVDNETNQDSPSRIIENNGANDDLNPKLASDQHESVKLLPELNIYKLGDKVKYKHPVTGWVDAIFKGFHTPELAPKGSKWSFMEISINGKLHKAYSLNQIKLA